MIDVEVDQQSQRALIIAQPNRSMTWQQLVVAYSIIAVFCLSTAIWFALMGAWLVLPFAGIELLALGAALYASAHRMSFKEVISIGVDTLYIERGRQKPEQRYEFMTTWARVQVARAKTKGYPDRVTISSHGNEVEVGIDLNEQEKKRLATEIKHQLDTFRRQ